MLRGKIFNLGGGPACRTTYRDFLNRSFKIMGLGHTDFPEHAFARQNFHCGYYDDSDTLEKLLHFQSTSVDSYFADLQRTYPTWKRALATAFRPLIKRYLLAQSEPYAAFRAQNDRDAALFRLTAQRDRMLLTRSLKSSPRFSKFGY